MFSKRSRASPVRALGLATIPCWRAFTGEVRLRKEVTGALKSLRLDSEANFCLGVLIAITGYRTGIGHRVGFVDSIGDMGRFYL